MPVTIGLTSVPVTVGLGAPATLGSGVVSPATGQLAPAGPQVASPAYWFYSPQLATSASGTPISAGQAVTLQAGAGQQPLLAHSLSATTAAGGSPPPKINAQPGAQNLAGSAALMATMTSLANVKDSRWLQLEVSERAGEQSSREDPLQVTGSRLEWPPPVEDEVALNSLRRGV